MANIRLIKRRIKSAKNISQITKAMELVAAAKMKKAQARALAGKLYANKIYEMVMRISKRVDISIHPLLKAQISNGKRLIILITTNKGLCGGLNASLFRYIIAEYKDFEKYDFITLGKKGADFVSRMGRSVKADFSDTLVWEDTIAPIVSLVVSDYIEGRYERIDVISNEFVSIATQRPRKKTMLPLTLEPQVTKSTPHMQSELSIEPSIEEVFDLLLPHYIENQIRDAVLQAEASEHSARMIAMHNATDNAKSLTHELTLLYNKARQEKITYEITDMVTARLAVE